MQSVRKVSHAQRSAALRRLRYLLSALGILLLSATLVTAQSGGDYDLTWSTIDGGGQTWSTGGHFSLGGATGQPDAGAQQTGGDFSLQGGFWHPVCRPTAMLVTISCTSDQVLLNWTADAANKAYTIHRSTDPYQIPESTNPQATVLAPPWTDPDPNTCGDTANNYFYVVRSVCIGAHVDADERAEFDFCLVPGA